MNEAGRIEPRSLAWTWLAGAWAFNLPWEIAQRPLYSGYEGFGPHLKGCFVASLGDVAIFGGLFGFMAAATGSRRWFEGSRARFSTLAAAGITLAAAIEYRALYLGKWSYSENMPLVPVLELGLSGSSDGGGAGRAGAAEPTAGGAQPRECRTRQEGNDDDGWNRA